MRVRGDQTPMKSHGEGEEGAWDAESEFRTNLLAYYH